MLRQSNDVVRIRRPVLEAFQAVVASATAVTVTPPRPVKAYNAALDLLKDDLALLDAEINREPE